MVYFAQSTRGGLIKIGTSLKLRERLHSLSKKRHEPLRVLGIIEGRHREERAVHDRFAHLRVEGEWFSPGDDLLAFISSECAPWDASQERASSTLFLVSGTQEWRQ